MTSCKEIPGDYVQCFAPASDVQQAGISYKKMYACNKIQSAKLHSDGVLAEYGDRISHE